MRNILLIILFILNFAINSVIAQPIAVKKGLSKKYPNAVNVKWTKDQDYWKAEFTLGGRKTTAEFDLEGQWINAQQEIDLEEIGVEEVKDAITKDFAKCKILKILIINNGTGTWYKVDGICGSEQKEHLYDHIGNPPPKIT